jgi:hypothetical protein
MKTEWLVSIVYILAVTFFFLFGVAISPVVRSDVQVIDSDQADINKCVCDHEKL